MDSEPGPLDSVHITSLVGFAFTELLGFKLLPRLKNIGAIQLYAPSVNQAPWPKLEKVLKKRPIDWDLIARNYDQMIKYSTALRLRTNEIEQVLRRFMKSSGGPKQPVHLALEELGRVVRTIEGGSYGTLEGVTETRRVGYARCSTDERDAQIQTEQLLALGVPDDRIYIDRGFSGTTRRNRNGLDQALAAVWPGSVFTVTKFDRFARNMAAFGEDRTGFWRYATRGLHSVPRYRFTVEV